MKNLILLTFTTLLILSCSDEKEVITYTFDFKEKPEKPTKSYRAVFNNITDISGTNPVISGFTKVGEMDVVHSTEAEWAYLILAHFENNESMSRKDYKLKYYESLDLFSTEINSPIEDSNNFYGMRKFIFTKNVALGNVFSKDSILFGISSNNGFGDYFHTEFHLIHEDHFPGYSPINQICEGNDKTPLEVLRISTGGSESINSYNALFLVYWDQESKVPIEQIIEEEFFNKLWSQEGCKQLEDNQIAVTKVIPNKKTIKTDLTVTINRGE